MSLLTGILKSPTERREAARIAALADPIIDRLVARTDRRLAHVPGYRESLRAPVLAARERLQAMIARIPGPIEVSPRSWSQDPGIRPLFSHAEDAAKAWSGDEGVRAFFEKHPASDCFGLLALAQADRKVLGTVQQGEIMTEVARTTVSYGEPQVLAPSVDDAQVRAELAVRALEYLALRGMEQVGAVRVRKGELEKEVALMRAQLSLAQRRGAGFGAVVAPVTAGIDDAATIERDLARSVGELEQVASKNLLPALAEEILAAFARPEEHLSIEPCAVWLDAMNFVVPQSPQSVRPRVAILRLAERGPFAVLVGRFPRAQLVVPEDRLADAARYL